ncbi:MAG: hypothetical protein HYX97_04955 [Chloroflexi bacterium]|nr:hypothetical protein [Chloroflexota bacterium]
MEQRVNPFALGGVFLQLCIKNRWVVHKVQGKKHLYLLTEEGAKALVGEPYCFALDKVLEHRPAMGDTSGHKEAGSSLQ